MLHMSGEMTKAMENHASGCCINIGTLESIAVSILPEILTGYSDKHPKVSVQIENGPTFGPNGLVERVLGHSCDLAFVSGDVEHPDIRKWVIGEDYVVIVTNKDCGETVDFKKLLQNQILSFPTGCVCRILYDRFVEHIGVKSKQVLESSSLSTIFSNVVAGMGVACFPKSCISFYKTRFPVYSYELPEPYTRMEWSLICRKDTYLTKPMKELIREAQRGKPYIDGVAAKLNAKTAGSAVASFKSTTVYPRSAIDFLSASPSRTIS